MSAFSLTLTLTLLTAASTNASVNDTSDTNTSGNASHCLAPAAILNASDPACVEGATIDYGFACTPKCVRGFTPSEAALNCTPDVAQLPDFACDDACAEFSVQLPSDSGSGSGSGSGGGSGLSGLSGLLCQHVSCAALVVAFGKGLALVSLGLFGHLPCSEIREWSAGQTLARVDVLVLSATDLEGAPLAMLQQQGFTGVVVLVDEGCDLQAAASLSSEELQRRLYDAGVAGVAREKSVDMEREALLELYQAAGQPPSTPPALRCWARRTIYLGSDRRAGGVYAAMVELPPSSLWLVQDEIHLSRVRDRLESLRRRTRSRASGRRSKLVGYLAHNCLPAAETFFDLAYERLGGAGTGRGMVEALGDCHGSHPEARPQACGGSSWIGPCREARADPATALAAYRFVIAFDAAADPVVPAVPSHPFQCPRHVGARASSLVAALLAGAVPVYRGPLEAAQVVNLEAVVFIPSNMPLEQGLLLLREAIADPTQEDAMVVAAALPEAATVQWFQWDTGLQRRSTTLAASMVAALQPLASGSPLWLPV